MSFGSSNFVPSVLFRKSSKLPVWIKQVHWQKIQIKRTCSDHLLFQIVLKYAILDYASLTKPQVTEFGPLWMSANCEL